MKGRKEGRTKPDRKKERKKERKKDREHDRTKEITKGTNTDIIEERKTERGQYLKNGRTIEREGQQ